MNAKEIQLLFQQDTDLRVTDTGIITNTSVGHPVFTPEELAYKTDTRKKLYNRTENGEDKYINVYYEGHESRNSEDKYFKVNGNYFQWNLWYNIFKGELISVSISADKKDDLMTHYHTTIVEERILGCPNYSENYEDVDNARESFLRKAWSAGRFGTAAYKALYHMDNRRLGKIWRDIIQLVHDSIADEKPFEMQMITDDKITGSFRKREFILQVAGNDIKFSTSEHCVDLYNIIAGSVDALLDRTQDVESIVRPFMHDELNYLWISGDVQPRKNNTAVKIDNESIGYFGRKLDYTDYPDNAADHDVQLINQIFALK